MNDNHVKNLSALELYMAKVYVWIMLIVTGSITCAGVTLTLLKALGFYPDVPWAGLLVFLGTDITYVIIGVLLIKKAVVNGGLRDGMLKIGKCYLSVILVIQYNFILYLIPSREFWGYTFFFIILTAFFLDIRMTGAISGILALSYIIFLFTKWRDALPVQDALFIPELILRAVAIVLSLGSICLLTWFVGEFLANAKRDELEEKHNQAQNVLDQASEIGTLLSATSRNVLQTAEAQSSSSQELSAITEELALLSKELLSRSRENTENLSRLNQTSEQVSEQISEVNQKNIQQKNLVELTYGYNSKMENQIEIQDQRFSKISSVIQDNVEEISGLTSQADQLNDIVNQLNQLLE